MSVKSINRITKGRSTIWDSKTKVKGKKRRTYSKPVSLKDEIEAGFKYFWAKRKVGIIRCTHFIHQ